MGLKLRGYPSDQADLTHRAYVDGSSVPSSSLARAMAAPVVMASPPTITENASSGVTSGVSLLPNASQFRFGGAPQIVVGGTTYKPRDAVHLDGTIANAWGGPCRLEFMFHGGVFEVGIWAGSGRNYRVWINGQPASTAMVAGLQAVTVTNAITYVRVDFGGRLAAPVHVVFEASGSAPQLYSIVREPTATITQPQTGSPRVIWLGDSYGVGTGATERALAFPIQAGRWLGWSDVWTFSSVPSTGLVTATAAYPTILNRIAADVLPYSPDVLVLQGSINDLGYTAGTITTALTAAIKQVRAALPACRIVCTSPIYVATAATNQTAYETMATEISAACTAMGVPFVDVVTGNAYFTGTGKVGTTTGDGNADYYRYTDGVHPSQAGHDALARIFAGRISTVLKTDQAGASENLAAIPTDPAAAVAGLRTLGTGAQQAAAGTDARLSDARTPTAHAATHVAGGTDDTSDSASRMTKGSSTPFPIIFARDTGAAPLGTAWGTIFEAAHDDPISGISIAVTTAPTGTPTLCRMGLYTINADGSGTLVARTSSTSTNFSTVGATRGAIAFDTTGGYPATYTIVRGAWYGFFHLQVGGTTGPTVRISSQTNGHIGLQPPVTQFVVSRAVGSLTDLPTTLIAISVCNNLNVPWYAGV